MPPGDLRDHLLRLVINSLTPELFDSLSCGTIPAPAAAIPAPTVTVTATPAKQKKSKVCQICHEEGHNSRTCHVNKCTTCNLFGHKKSDKHICLMCEHCPAHALKSTHDYNACEAIALARKAERKNKKQKAESVTIAPVSVAAPSSITFAVTFDDDE